MSSSLEALACFSSFTAASVTMIRFLSDSLEDEGLEFLLDLLADLWSPWWDERALSLLLAWAVGTFMLPPWLVDTFMLLPWAVDSIMLLPWAVDSIMLLPWVVDDLFFSGVADLPRWDEPFSGVMKRAAAGSWLLLWAEVVLFLVEEELPLFLVEEELPFFSGVADLLQVVVSDELLDELLLDELLEEDNLGGSTKAP